ncbi:MAG: hypothetical protein JWP09_213 [Candidatus Taylorbacteria bacterium]|nr:hypothetical protein [Candidatus Taylorbacteria bacterium]
MELKTIKEKMKEVSRSKYFNLALIAVALVVWTGLILQLGMIVGYQKASYFFKSGDNYYKNLRGPKPMPMGLNDNDLPRSHGAIGKVLQVSLPEILIEDKDGAEKTIIVGSSTIIKKLEGPAEANSISIGDYVVTIGNPNGDAKIEAKLIRILPPLPEEDNNNNQ